MPSVGVLCSFALATLLSFADPVSPTPTPARTGYAGDAICIGCHSDLSGTYSQTAHHRTSQLPTSASVGGLKPGATAVLKIYDPLPAVGLPGLSFTMESRNGGFFEGASTGFGPNPLSRTERIDLVTGSGHRGQTYLYWQGDALLSFR